MRVLLSTIGSRGDVQPIVALALALKARGEDVRVCVPPDFREWIEGLGIHVTTIGPELRGTAKPSQSTGMPTAEQRRVMIEGTVATQFETLTAAAEGCDVIVGATALQVAAPSIAERMGLPYVFAAYCPAVLPSTQHAPPVLTMSGDKPAANVDYASLWMKDAQRWNQTWGEIINAHRAALGLPAIDDVRDYVITKPWLAADASLGPWRDEAHAVFQTGAWILADNSPLPEQIEAFLEAGDPPVYFGFGSIRAPADLSRAMIDSSRALGRRAIVSRGWAELALIDDAKDCLSIGDVNHQALFTRVAAAVHHGGAGTTTAAARAGAPQVIIPQHYDQFYWAQRIQELGIGAAHTSPPTTESLTRSLAVALQSDVAARAEDLATHVRSDGVDVAARAIAAL